MGKTISAARITQMFDRLLHACDELAHTFLPRQTLDLALIDIATTEALVPLSDLIEKLERMQTRTNVINAVPQEMAMTDTQQDTSLSSQKTTHQKFPRPASLAPASSASAPSLPQKSSLTISTITSDHVFVCVSFVTFGTIPSGGFCGS